MLVNTAILGVMLAISGVMTTSSLPTNIARMGANRSEVVFEAISNGLAGHGSHTWSITFYATLFLLSELLPCSPFLFEQLSSIEAETSKSQSRKCLAYSFRFSSVNRRGYSNLHHKHVGQFVFKHPLETSVFRAVWRRPLRAFASISHSGNEIPPTSLDPVTNAYLLGAPVDNGLDGPLHRTIDTNIWHLLNGGRDGSQFAVVQCRGSSRDCCPVQVRVPRPELFVRRIQSRSTRRPNGKFFHCPKYLLPVHINAKGEIGKSNN